MIQREYDRVLALLPGTDPRDGDYKYLLDVLGLLCYLPDAGAPAPQQEPPELMPTEEPAPQSGPTLSEIRGELAAMKLEGYNITQILGHFGAKKLSDVPEARYADMMAYIEEVKKS